MFQGVGRSGNQAGGGAVELAVLRAAALCGERSTAYLRMAFAHSDAPVRAQVIDSLQKCGVDPASTLQHDESERRRKALELLASHFGAQRARGARELGLLGRDEDRARLLPLLGERDGVVVAAAARAVGESGASDAAPRIAALLADGGEVAAAAAEALLALGAAAPARPQLLRLATAAGDEAVPAAAALASDAQAPKSDLCAAALGAQVPQTAALLAAGCPAAPFARALPGAAKRDPLLEALLRAEPPAPGLEATLTKLLRAGETDVRLPILARKYRVAGPALLDVLKREQAARATAKRADDDEGSAAEIAKAPAQGLPNRERYARLMTLLSERAGSESAKVSAASRLDALLHGSAGSDRRTFVSEVVKAVRELDPPGAAKLLPAFTKDAEPPQPGPKSLSKPALEPRIAVWSDDGAVRARACPAADPATRKLLAAADPERRVRLACSATNETAPRK